jgi:hypothetical protein
MAPGDQTLALIEINLEPLLTPVFLSVDLASTNQGA